MTPLSTAKCPHLDIVADIDHAFKTEIIGEMFIWWHCPACGGWHVLTQEQSSGPRALARFKDRSSLCAP